MTKQNPSGLRISPDKYRIADIVLGVVFAIVTVIALYFAIADGVRDFWLLVVVGIIGAILMGRRILSDSSEV